MAITAQDVNKLRKMTGAGMMECKKALTEADGDFDKAIEILRKKGQKVSDKRADRATAEGIVVIKINDAGSKGILVGLGCETDFVAKNEEFQQLAKDIAELAAKEEPADKDALLASKLNKLTVQETITELVGKIGEKIDITNFEVMEGEKVVPYVHSNGKIGVMVALKGVGSSDYDGAGKDVAMQIAAMKPVAVDKDDVPQDIIDKELEIGREQAKAEGKPDNILDKIAQGKLNKYFKDHTLLNQPFVKDNSQTIAKYLDGVNKGMTVTKFSRVEIGA